LKNWLALIIAFLALGVSLVVIVSLTGVSRDVRNIAGRMVAVEKGLEETRAVPQSMAEMGQRIADLEGQLKMVKGLEEEIRALSATLAEKSQTLEDLSRARKAMESSLARFEENLNAWTTKVTTLEETAKKLEVLQESLRNLEQSIAALSIDERFSALLQYFEGKVRELKQTVADLSGRLETSAALSQEVEELRSTLVSTQGDVQRLQGEMRELLEEKTRTLQEDVGKAIIALEEKVRAMEQSIAALSVDERFSALLQYFEGKIQEVRDALFTLQQEVTAWKEKTVPLEVFEKALQTLEEKFQSLEQEFTEYEKKTEESMGNLRELLGEVQIAQEDYGRRLEESLLTFSQKITALEKELQGLSQSVASFGGDFEKVQVTFQEFSQRLSNLQEKLLGFESGMDTWKETTLQSLRKEVEALAAALPSPQDLEEVRAEVVTLLEERESLRARFQELAAEQANIVQELEGKGKDILALKEKIATLSEKEEVANLRAQLAMLLDVQSNLENALKKTEENIRALEASLQAKDEEVARTLEKLFAQVQDLSQSLESFGRRLEEVHAQGQALSPVREDLVEIQKTLELLDARLAEIEKFSKEMLREDLKTRVKAIEGEIATLQGELGKVAEESRASIPELQTIRSLLENLEKNKASLEERIEELYSLLESGKKREEIEKDIESLLREKDTLQEEIKRLAQERMDLEGELGRRKEELARIDRELEVLRAQEGSAERIQELEREREEAEKAIDRLQQELKDKEDQIEALQRRNEELSAQLEEAKKFTSYVILPWDSLWKIARRYYRDGRKWRIIWEANREKIPDPEKLQPYVEIRIPRVPENS
jgi:chromosome segregation ATPase